MELSSRGRGHSIFSDFCLQPYICKILPSLGIDEQGTDRNFYHGIGVKCDISFPDLFLLSCHRIAPLFCVAGKRMARIPAALHSEEIDCAEYTPRRRVVLRRHAAGRCIALARMGNTIGVLAAAFFCHPPRILRVDSGISQAMDRTREISLSADATDYPDVG